MQGDRSEGCPDAADSVCNQPFLLTPRQLGQVCSITQLAEGNTACCSLHPRPHSVAHPAVCDYSGGQALICIYAWSIPAGPDAGGAAQVASSHVCLQGGV